MTVALALPGWGTSTTRLQPLVSALRARDVDARPYAYRPRGSIRGLGAELARDAGRVDGDVHLVGHSLGGLVAASAVLHHGAPVASVTTINAPFRGTWAAWTADRDDSLGQELRWRSDALEQLRDALELHLREPSGPRWRVLSALGDLAAPPTGALRVPSGDRLETSLVPVNGHSVSLLHERMVDEVVGNVLGRQRV